MTDSAIGGLLSLVEDAINPGGERHKKWMQDARRGVVRAALLLGVILYALDSDPPYPQTDVDIVSGWGALLMNSTTRRAGGVRDVSPVDPATLLEIKGIPNGWERGMSLEDADDFLWRNGLGFRCSDILAYWRGDPSPYTAEPPREADAASQAKPLQRSLAQDAAVLDQLKSLGFEPSKVPRNPPGRPGVKAQVRNALVGKSALFQTNSKTFEKAWERLRKAGEIKDA